MNSLKILISFLTLSLALACNLNDDDISQSGEFTFASINIGQNYLQIEGTDNDSNGRVILSNESEGIFLDITVFAGNSYVLSDSVDDISQVDSYNLTLLKSHFNNRVVRVDNQPFS